MKISHTLFCVKCYNIVKISLKNSMLRQFVIPYEFLISVQNVERPMDPADAYNGNFDHIVCDHIYTKCENFYYKFYHNIHEFSEIYFHQPKLC